MEDEGDCDEQKRKFLEGITSPWSVGIMPDGRVFFINKETQTTSWLDPRTNTPFNTTKTKMEGLPLGWEEAVTSEGVYYFIDHNRMKTTFNSPVTGKPKSLDRYGSDGSLETSPSPQRLPRTTSSEWEISLRKVVTKKQFGVLNRDPDANVTLTGWLHKQGSRPPKTWKKRWFVLSEYCLFYYKSQSENQAHARILLPGYEITPVTREDKIGKKFAFKAAHANMRTYYFAADSKETMMKWINNMTLATLMMTDKQAGEDDLVSANGSPSSYRQREDKHLQNAVDLEESGSLRDSQESVVSEVQNSSEEVLGKRRQMAKISSVAKLQEVTHSSEMTTTTTSTRVPSDTESINSAKLVAKELEELSARIAQLEAENRQLAKERRYYCSVVETSKANLIGLKKSMFETLTGLQRELIEQQETNALLKQKIEELESEINRSRPFTAMADQMVVLGNRVADENETLIKQLEKASESLMLASEKARSGPSQKLLEFSRKLQEEKQQQTQALILRQFLMSGEADLETKLTDLGHIEDQMRESSTLVTNLQEEKADLEHQLNEAWQIAADQSEKDSQTTALLQTQLAETTQKLTTEEQAMEEKAQENSHLEQEVSVLRERLQTAENINKAMLEQGESSDQNKAKLKEDLAAIHEELCNVATEKTQLKQELENLKGSLLNEEKAASGLLETPLHELSTSPEESPLIKRKQSHMTQLEMSLELASYRAKLQEAADTKEKLADLKTKLQREQMTRQNSRRGSYSVPRWVRDLELSSRKSEKRRCSRIRDPEKLSFREKLEIFLQPQ